MAEPKKVETDSKDTRLKVVRFRENRILVGTNLPSSVKIVSQNETYQMELIDVSPFGFRADSNNNAVPFKTSEYLKAEISLGNYQIYSGTVKLVNDFDRNGRLSCGFSLIDGMIDSEHVSSIIEGAETKSIFNSAISFVESFSQISSNFKSATSDMAALLNDIERKFRMEQEKLDGSGISETHKKKIQETTIDLAISLYAPVMHALFEQFEHIVKEFSPDQHVIHKKYFRTVFTDLVKGTPFLQRAFEKPLGYAGDFGLMNMFYQYEDIGSSLFHKFMHRYACNQPAAVANKNRVTFLVTLLEEFLAKTQQKEESVKITSVACGPAQEIVELITASAPTHGKLIVNLIDQEPKALEHAVKNIRKANQKKFDLTLNAFQEDAVLGCIKGKPFMQEISQSDAIVSAGLFDYLSERVASKMIDTLYKYLRPGGTLLIGNVSTENPDKFMMDYLMEWNLLLRNKNHLQQLVSKEIMADAKSVEVRSEPLGLNLFLLVTK